MATVQHTKTVRPDHSYRFTWEGMAADDVGEWARFPGGRHQAIQVGGDFAAAKVTFDVSTEDEPSENFFSSLTTIDQSIVEMKNPGYFPMALNMYCWSWIRPRVNGGTASTSIKALVLCRGRL